VTYERSFVDGTKYDPVTYERSFVDGTKYDPADLESAVPVRGESSEKVGDFGVTWLEPPTSTRSGEKLADTDSESSSDLPAAARLHSCEYCEWGYFGNEASDVDFYIYAALHVRIPKLGEGPRSGTLPQLRTTKKRALSRTTKGAAKKKITQVTKKKTQANTRKKKDGG